MFNKLLKKYAKNEKGLTLIELLVVIVILGIIAAIAVVSIGGIIGNTKDKAKVTEAVQIINAAKLKHSTDGALPSDGSWDATDLAENISNVKSTGWTVTWTQSGGYTIKGHNSATLQGIGKAATDNVPEKTLTDYLDK
ncbi:type II secretion system protein [Fictibacillus phosphorivorans]|uniref:type II secretion system protein n=1 Tax=Fictibacillus phosphorivorans TaxID=1221500 RepID=UPI00129312C2|nr:prepilin-type N-terminal cleavage/methylation domain-containing protein [Fictibacillus phosphorivorans]MQR94845.1 type II secretion system protein [Fictibacillus phosphorivorans]